MEYAWGHGCTQGGGPVWILPQKRGDVLKKPIFNRYHLCMTPHLILFLKAEKFSSSAIDAQIKK